MASKTVSGSTYSFILLAHVAVVALAGVTGNVRLFQLLAGLGGSKAVAFRVLLAWLAGNLFLGSQLSWILRPFIGSPTLPVEFFRQTAFHGNFFEAVFHSLQQIIND
jgi:predicted membrane-bound spermidine synthase